MNKCQATQHSDQMVCKTCDQAWDVNDPDPPACKVGDAVKAIQLAASGALGTVAKAVQWTRQQTAEAEARRPGLAKSTQTIRDLNPHLGPSQCYDIANRLYDATTIAIYVDGPLVVVPNPLFKGGQ